MIYDTLQAALDADPKRKGVGLFEVRAHWQRGQPTGMGFDNGSWERVTHWIWARAKADAISKVATRLGYEVTKYHAGAEVGGEIEAPLIQGEMHD